MGKARSLLLLSVPHCKSKGSWDCSCLILESIGVWTFMAWYHHDQDCHNNWSRPASIHERYASCRKRKQLLLDLCDVWITGEFMRSWDLCLATPSFMHAHPIPSQPRNTFAQICCIITVDYFYILSGQNGKIPFTATPTRKRKGMWSTNNLLECMGQILMTLSPITTCVKLFIIDNQL